MNLEQYLMQQLAMHPSIQAQDLVKLCYQVAYGAEHLLSDLHAARNYLEKEYALTEANDIALYEAISDDVCRVNLAAWKFKNLPPEWLFQMFAASSDRKGGSKELFFDSLQAAENIVKQGHTGISQKDWQTYVTEYKKIGMPAVHHSTQYREHETPAYRIVNAKYIRLFPLLEQAAKRVHNNKVCVIAMDGRAASGKSTMAGQLKMILGASVIRMDDFFLPLELRTEERLQTPGGNVHYERFAKEVLPYLSLPQPFSYRKFDCGNMDYDGECIIEPTRYRIVEGSYSCHPQFGDYADLTVFSDASPEEQLRRILRRNGEEMAETFRKKWIPLEENYFEFYHISQKADVIL